MDSKHDTLIDTGKSSVSQQSEFEKAAGNTVPLVLHPCFVAFPSQPDVSSINKVKTSDGRLLTEIIYKNDVKVEDLSFIARKRHFANIQDIDCLRENATSPATSRINLRLIWGDITYGHNINKGNQSDTVSDILKDVLTAMKLYSRFNRRETIPRRIHGSKDE